MALQEQNPPATKPTQPNALLYGREDVLAEIDARLQTLSDRTRYGVVLIVGSKGTGKSIILETWLARHQHESLEYKGMQVADTIQYLCRALEDRLRQLTGSGPPDSAAAQIPEVRLVSLIELLSEAAKSKQTRVILMLRILDVYRDIALQRVLPPLCDQIFFVSSATLTSNVQRQVIDLRENQPAKWDIEVINLDEPRFRQSADQACQLYWQDWLAQFPPARAAQIDQTLRPLALQRANGNFLYLRKLCQWIGKDAGPVESWPKRLHELPSDLLELQKRRWDQEGYTPQQRQHVLGGLCLLAAAYAPLPRHVIHDDDILGVVAGAALWGDAPDASFWLVREDAAGRDPAAEAPCDRVSQDDERLRLFHPVVADFLRRQLGQEAAIKAAHRKLARAAVRKWQSQVPTFWNGYGPRFAAAHLFEAGSPRSAVELFGSPAFLAAQIAQGLGISGLLETLQRASTSTSSKELQAALDQLTEAVRSEAPFLQQEPAALFDQLLFRLSAMPATQPGLALSLLRPAPASVALRRRPGLPIEDAGCQTVGRHQTPGAVLGLAVLPTRQVVSVNSQGETRVFALDTPAPPLAWPDANTLPFAVAVAGEDLLLFSATDDGCRYPLRPRDDAAPTPQPLPLTGTLDDRLAVVLPLATALLTVSERGQVALVPHGNPPSPTVAAPVAAAWREDADGRELIGIDEAGSPHLWRIPRGGLAAESAQRDLGVVYPCPRAPKTGWAVLGLGADEGLLSVLALGRDAMPVQVAQCQAHAGYRVRCCAFTADGKTALTGDDAGRVVAWDLATGRILRQLQDRSGCEVSAVAWLEDGQHAILGFASGAIKRWALGKTAPSVERTSPPPAWTTLHGAVADGRILAQADDGLYLCSPGNGTQQKLTLDPGITDAIAAVPVADGHELIIWTLDAVWRCDLDGRALAPALPHHPDDRLLACFPDGTRLLMATIDATVCIVHLADGRRVALADLFAVTLWLLAAVSPDGTRIACALPDQLGVWDADSGASLASLPAPPDPQQLQLAQCDNGLKLLLVSEKGVQIYDFHENEAEPQPFYAFAEDLPGPINIRQASLLRDGALVLLNSGSGPNWLRVLRPGAEPPADRLAVLFEFSGEGGLVVCEGSTSEADLTVLDRDHRLCALRLTRSLPAEGPSPLRVRMVATDNDRNEAWAQCLRDQLMSMDPPLLVLDDEAGAVESELPGDTDIVVLLLSASALSNATWKSLAKAARDRQAHGQCLVVPVRARPVASLEMDYEALEVVPWAKRALSQIPPHEIDEVCGQIARYVRERWAGTPLWQGETLGLRLPEPLVLGSKA